MILIENATGKRIKVPTNKALEMIAASPGKYAVGCKVPLMVVPVCS